MVRSPVPRRVAALVVRRAERYFLTISTAQIFKSMDMQKKKMIVMGSVVGGVIIIFLLVLYFGGWMRGGAGTVAPGAPGTPVAPGASLSPSSSLTNVVFNKSVYDVALARAVVWQSGAALAKMTLADTSGGTWDFIFVSSKMSHNGK